MSNRTHAETITSYYESYTQNGIFSHFDKIGFLNAGYWRGIDDNLEMAQINLVETLTRFFLNTNGTVLDVACGRGASTKYLTKRFDPRRITGINISEPQLEACKVIAPECAFHLMDATSLGFENDSVDNVLCIEAAVHFQTRQNFFDEVYRVLSPSGRLAMLDNLFDNDLLKNDDAGAFPRENYLPSLDAYKDELLNVGFKYVRIDDCSALTGRSACAYVVRRLESEFGRTQDERLLDQIRFMEYIYKAAFAWGLIYAIK